MIHNEVSSQSLNLEKLSKVRKKSVNKEIEILEFNKLPHFVAVKTFQQ